MSYANYATLGNACQTSLDVLVDNKKFLAMDDLVYNIMYTRMKRYPLYTVDKAQDVISDDDRVFLENGKNLGKGEEDEEEKEEPKPETYSCCGRR